MVKVQINIDLAFNDTLDLLNVLEKIGKYNLLLKVDNARGPGSEWPDIKLVGQDTDVLTFLEEVYCPGNKADASDYYNTYNKVVYD